MPAVQAIIILACRTVLASCLYIKLRRWASEDPAPGEWTGKSIDVGEIKPKVDDVRRNYLAARQSAKGVRFHKALLGFTRRAVARLAYFRDRKSEEHAHTHDP